MEGGFRCNGQGCPFAPTCNYKIKYISLTFPVAEFLVQSIVNI